MDLVGRDKFTVQMIKRKIADLEKMLEEYEDEVPKRPKKATWNIVNDDTARVFKHGRLITSYECSNCKYRPPVSIQDPRTKYCPECGSIMHIQN